MQQHRLPQEVIDVADKIFTKDIYKAMRDNNRKKLLAAGFVPRKLGVSSFVAEHEKLPGWVIKFSHRFSILFSTISRISMAEDIQSYLIQEDIDTILVPKKYLYHIPHRKHKLIDKNYMVFCEKIQVRPKKEPRVFSSQVIYDMLKLINHFSILDASPGNMARIDENNIAMLDTEPTNRRAGGLWYVLDNSATRAVKRWIGKKVFLSSLDES